MEFQKHLPQRHFQHILTMPFIYFMIIPSVFLDISLEIYHRICFPLYGLKYIKRKEYIRVDRHKLKYLNIRDRIHCMYCGYVNGLMHYAMTIAGRTEWYWCGIRHKKGKKFHAPIHQDDFLPYNNEKAYKEFLR